MHFAGPDRRQRLVERGVLAVVGGDGGEPRTVMKILSGSQRMICSLAIITEPVLPVSSTALRAWTASNRAQRPWVLSIPWVPRLLDPPT